MAQSPSVLNYQIAKGKVFFTPNFGAGSGVEVDLGNAPECEVTPASDTITHQSSRAGVAVEDYSVNRSFSVELRMVLDEITLENLRFVMLSDIDTDSDGARRVRIGSKTLITGAIRVEGTNTVGNQFEMVLPSVSFGPSGSLPLISDEWNRIEATGKVLYNEDLGDFGTITEIEDQSA